MVVVVMVTVMKTMMAITVPFHIGSGSCKLRPKLTAFAPFHTPDHLGLHYR